MQSVLVVDVSNVLYRNFHALRKTNMRLKTSEPIWAVHGFFLSIAKLNRLIKPDFIVFALDSETGCPFRREIVPEYKQHRPPISGDLKTQLVKTYSLLVKSGFTTIQIPLWEADDAVASVVNEAESKHFYSYIATADRDAFQLISPETFVVDAKGSVINEDKLFDLKGVSPKGYLFLAALRGEPSDGITGVPLIGEKSATGLAQIIESYNLQNPLDAVQVLSDTTIYQSLLTEKQSVSLQKNLQLFARNIKVAFLNRTLPVGDCFKPIDVESVGKVFFEEGLTKVADTLQASFTF